MANANARECRARKERQYKWARRPSITKWCGNGSTVNDKIRLFTHKSQDMSIDNNRASSGEKQEHTENVRRTRGYVKDMVTLFEATASDVQRRSVLTVSTPQSRTRRSEICSMIGPEPGLLTGKDVEKDRTSHLPVSRETRDSALSLTDDPIQQLPVKTAEVPSQDLKSLPESVSILAPSGLIPKDGEDQVVPVISETVVEHFCESRVKTDTADELECNDGRVLKKIQSAEITGSTNNIITPSSLNVGEKTRNFEVNKCPTTLQSRERLHSWSYSGSAKVDTVDTDAYAERKHSVKVDSNEGESEGKTTAHYRRRTLARSDAFDEDFEGHSFLLEKNDVTDVEEPVTPRYKLPWNWKREHYQNYARRSDETLSAQIDNLYNSTTCLDLASYLLIRNGRRTIFSQISGALSPSPVALDIITGPRKILWQNVPEVLSSGVLVYMSKKQINLQEALFEIITSEASYVYSLSILEEHYIKHIKKGIPFALTEKIFKAIFSTLEPIIKSAHIFFGDLLSLWHQDMMLNGLCNVVERHYENFAKLYLKYARNSESILNTYHTEVAENSAFRTLALGLAETPQAEKLPLDSFLTLPLQRITRMPLLLKSAIAQSDEDSPSFGQCIRTLFTVESLASECNEEVGRMRQYEEMLRITQDLTFPPDVINFPLVKATRYLQLRSSARRVKNSSRLSRRERLELFLFNDLFLYAKNSNEKPFDRITVCDYCPRSAITLEEQQNRTFPQSIQFQLLSNSEGKKETLQVMFELESDRQRWLTAFNPLAVEAEGKQQRRQVIALHRNDPQRPDELSLEIGDVLVVFDQHDELMHGARVVDGVVGWFPASCCKVITSPVVQRYNESASQRHTDTTSVILDEAVIEQESTA